MGTVSTCSREKKEKNKITQVLDDQPECLWHYVQLFWARERAHECLDQLWKGNKAPYTRAEAYEILQDVMELPANKAHISDLTAKQCETLIWRFLVRGLA